MMMDNISDTVGVSWQFLDISLGDDNVGGLGSVATVFAAHAGWLFNYLMTKILSRLSTAMIYVCNDSI